MKTSPTVPLLQEDRDFQEQVYSSQEKRSAEQKQGLPSYWTRCKTSFLLYVILDCMIQFSTKKKGSSWMLSLTLSDCSNREEASSVSRSTEEAPRSMPRSTPRSSRNASWSLTYLPTWRHGSISFLRSHWMPNSSPSEPYIFFDERANEKRTGIEREIQ